nr:hypothetical protein [Tanacetum cinerariifolium]
VMDARTLPVSVEKNPGDPIDIRVYIVHPTPADVFPTETVEINALRFKMGMVEEENASLRGCIKTMEAIDTITRRQEKRARKVRYLHAAGCCTNLVEWSCENLRSRCCLCYDLEILKKKLTDKYCPKGEIKKLEIELWNLKVKGNDVGGEIKKLEIELWNLKVDKYISGLLDNIHGNVMAARPKTLDDAIELANDLMDQKLRTYAERQAENKRKLNNNH